MKTASVLLLILFFCSFAGEQSYAQSISVNPSTGSPAINIPLYTLKYGQLSVPVNVMNTSNGVPVEGGEGDAGIGWNLSCNYGVYRQVRGLPDFDDHGVWSGGTPAAATAGGFVPSSDDNTTDIPSASDEVADFNAINAIGYTKDTEPDVYVVNGPGLNFRFVFDATSTPRLLDYQDIKITKLVGASGFTVQNNTGQTYQFTTAENVSHKTYAFKSAVVDMFTTGYNQYNTGTPTSYTQVWNLTSVTDQFGNVINFSYSTAAAINTIDYKTRITTTTNIIDTLYTNAYSFTPKVLNTITAGNYTVSFFWTSTRRLTSIKVSESGLGDSFQYGFDYAQRRSSTGGLSHSVIHNFLTAINPVTTPLCVAQVPYKFSYQGVTASTFVEIPWTTSYSQDMWGYYNGVTANHLVPQVYFYSGNTDSRRFLLVSNGTASQTFTGADRSVKSATIANGALLKLSYPSGGSTRIVWERNKYRDSLTSQTLYGPGLRVASLISDGGEAAYGRAATASNAYHQIIKNYTYGQTLGDTSTCSGIVLYPPSFAFATGSRFIRSPEDMGPGSYVVYRTVSEIIPGQGATFFTFSYPAMYPVVSYSTDWTATKSKIARNPSNRMSVTDIKNGYYTFPFAPNPNYGFGQGMMTNQAQYAEGGALVRQVHSTYSRIAPSLQSVYGLKFERLGTADCDCFHFSKYQIITGTTNVLTKKVVTEVSETNSAQSVVTTTYHYNSDIPNQNFLMDSVRTNWGDGSVTRTKLRYIKDFASLTNPLSTDVMANAIPLMITANRHGELVEQFSTYTPAGGTAVVADAALHLYKNFSGKVYPWQSYSFPARSTFTAAAVGAGPPQTFTYDGKYILATSMNDFDAMGNPVSVSDNKQNIIGAHYPLNYALPPVASFVNSTARQTVYEGFEFATGRNLTPSTALTYTAGWTGVNAATLPATTTLSHTAVDNAGAPYRVSCYVKAAQASNITFTLSNPDGSSPVSAILAYKSASINQWTYLEGTINVTSTVPSGPVLTFQVGTNASVSIDDIILLPQTGTVTTQTILPLKGVTSQTDDRGVSSVITYDALGRKTSASDRQRNLTEIDEYQMKGTAVGYINSGFTYTDIAANQAFTASILPNGNCFSSITYQWQFDGTVVGTNSPTLTMTTATSGLHSLQLTVTNNSTGQSGTTTQSVCVAITAVPPVFSFTNSTVNNTICNTDINPTFTVTPTNGCGTNTSSFITYWSVSTDGGTTYTRVTGQNTTLTYAAGTSFRVKAELHQFCSGSGGTTCNGASETISTQTVAITMTICNGN